MRTALHAALLAVPARGCSQHPRPLRNCCPHRLRSYLALCDGNVGLSNLATKAELMARLANCYAQVCTLATEDESE